MKEIKNDFSISATKIERNTMKVSVSFEIPIYAKDSPSDASEKIKKRVREILKNIGQSKD